MYDIGIDVGGTGIAAGLVDSCNRIVAQKTIPTDRSLTARGMSETLVALTDELLSEAKVSKGRIKSVGVGVPGPANRKTGRIEYANNLPYCQGNIRQLLQAQTSKKVYFENDANAAAWGEYLCLERRPESFVMVTLGTGVGGGIIQNGRILRGINYAAAELGHMTIRYDGIPCNCGRKGCFEAYASAEALAAQAREMMEKKKKSLMWELCGGDLTQVNGRLVFDAVRRGDKAASKVVEDYAGYLSEGLANIINILQPEVLCIGGGISKSADLLIPMLQVLVRDKVYSRESTVNTRLVAAKPDSEAGIIGAAKLRLSKDERSA